MKYICPLPWNHISIMPSGTSSICCSANHKNSTSFAKTNNDTIINANTDSIEQIVNSSTYRQIRKDMLAGIQNKACETCYSVERNNGVSKRQQLLTTVLPETINEYKNITNKDGTIVPAIENVELRLGNICNLKCRTCNSDSSTSWISDSIKLKDTVPLTSYYDKNAIRYKLPWFKNPRFYDDLSQHMSNVKIVNINGGEPFLINDHIYFIEKLKKYNKKNIILYYITNLNFDRKKVKKILDLVKSLNLSKVIIACSIDDVTDRNTYIRSLSDWKLTLENLTFFIDNYSEFEINVVQTISVYNFMYVEELYNFLKNNNLMPNDGLKLNHVHSPIYLNANVLPIKIRQQKLNSIQTKIPDHLLNELKSIYYLGHDNGMFSMFKKFTINVDKIRGENFEKLFSKLHIIKEVTK